MLLRKGGEFDLNTQFNYDEQWANEIYQQLLDNQKAIKNYAQHNETLQKIYDDNLNVFQTEADKYDPYAENQLDDNVKTSKYFYTYTSMYKHVSPKDLFGREKPFDFLNEFSRVSKTFGIDRSLSKTVVTTPYFIPTSPEQINNALLRLANRIEFEWNNDNPLVLISKMVPFITAIQPLSDGNHRASHAMLQYYLGKAGLPSILRKKDLREHFQGYSIFERNAIENDTIDDIIAYYWYNVLERQEQICEMLVKENQDHLLKTIINENKEKVLELLSPEKIQELKTKLKTDIPEYEQKRTNKQQEIQDLKNQVPQWATDKQVGHLKQTLEREERDIKLTTDKKSTLLENLTEENLMQLSGALSNNNAKQAFENLTEENKVLLVNILGENKEQLTNIINSINISDEEKKYLCEVPNHDPKKILVSPLHSIPDEPIDGMSFMQ